MRFHLVTKLFRFVKKLKLICVFLTLFLLASGCDQKNNNRETKSRKAAIPSKHFSYVDYAAKRGKVVYNVKYQPRTVVFDEPATERAFRSVSRDGSTYVLEASEPAVRELKPGSVLFLYGVALRKVTGLRTKGSDVVVSTTQAELTDAIRDGEIAWEVPVDFTAGTTTTVAGRKTSSLSDLIIPPVWAAEEESPNLQFEGSFLDFDFAVKFTPEGADRIKIHISLKTTKLGGAVVEITGDGYVQHLTSIGKILISNGAVDELDFNNNGFNGKVEFTWTAQQQTVPTVVKAMKIRIPGASWEYPLIIGGLPFTLEVSAAVIVHPALTSKGSFSTGEYSVSYDAKAGFKTTKAGTTGEGGGDSTQEIKHDTSIFGIGPAGFVAALELPRVELALGFISPVSAFDSNLPNMDLIAGLAPNSKFSLGLVTTKIAEAWEVALPIKPFAYFDVVTSASTTTAGVTGTMPMPGAVLRVPCEKATLVLAANVGVGAKIGLPLHGLLPHSVTSALGPLVPHELTAEPFESAVNIYEKTSSAYKNGKKCLGDE
jgi:hypothetical protein